MELIPTSAVFMLGVAVVILGRFMSNQPYEPGKPRYIPWTIVMITGGAIAIFMLVHFFSLMGLEVGGGRRMP